VQAAAAKYQEGAVMDESQVEQMQQAYLERYWGPRNPQAASREAWEARRLKVRRHVLDSLGLLPLPERLPLDVHKAGTLDRDGYTVTRLYWQTWPGYYAAGYLYMPRGLTGKAPATINPHGHWENGDRHPVVQSRLISLARKGYVSLTIDSVHAYDYYSGVTPLTVMMWNNIRGLDLLCSLPEVDAARIGCTGCSGGGQQTFYLTALEDRLAAAVPVCMVCEFKRILSISEAHCPCNHVAGVAAETDETEMAACLAPKPSLYICVTGDWTQWFPQEGYPEIQAIYDLHGAGDKVNCIQHDWGHDYNQAMREQMYAWFGKWLKGTQDPAEALEGPLETESLETLAALDGPPAGARGLEAVYEERRASRAAAAASPEALRAKLREVFREEPLPAAVSGEEVGREERDGVTVVSVLVQTEPDVRVPVLELSPSEGGAAPLPAVVVADSQGKALLAAEHWDELVALARRGLRVVLVDPRFYGEWSLRADVQRLNGILFGRPPAAVGAHDLLAVVRWLQEREGVDPARVALVGLGDAGPLVVMAGGLEPSVAAVAADAIGPTYAAGRESPTTCGLVTVGDLPELAAACAPRPLWLAGTHADAAWGAAEHAYATAPGGLTLTVDAAPGLGEGLQAWLEATLRKR
jgi:cephalosporin-C deacetylase-like acetyl esterase